MIGKKKKTLKLTRRGTLHLIKDIYDKTIANITLDVIEVFSQCSKARNKRLIG